MIDALPVEIRSALHHLVALVVGGQYEEVRSNGWLGRLTVDELAEAVKEYPGELVPLPRDGWEAANVITLDSSENAWVVEIPMWTDREGRSDLELAVCAKVTEGKLSVEIDDLHVM